MSFGSISTVSSKLIAVVVLVFAVSSVIAVLGVFFKVLQYPNWELFLQIGILGSAGSGLVGMSIGVVWAVRTLRRSTE